MKPKVFIDTNVVLDLLAHRKPFYKEAQMLFSLADQGKFLPCVSALTICNGAYILRKEIGIDKMPEVLRKFVEFVTITHVDNTIVWRSIDEECLFKDIEDAMQYYSALDSDCECIVTRNIKDYKFSEIPVFTPIECITKILES